MKKKKTIINILLIIFMITLFISIYHIINHKKYNINIKKQLQEINDIIQINELTDNETTEIIEPIEEIPESNPYWDYIKINLIDVNFKELKTINNNTKGWIQVNGTNINYPFVQTSNNSYYLNHDFNKKINGAGWVFLDYRNDLSNTNEKNTIIYAHGRIDNTMFGTLRNSLTNGWLNNKNNHIIKISTEYENTLWQVFSIYRIPTTSDYLKTEFNDDNEYQEFLNILKERSNYNFNTTVTSSNRILTLSTCYDNNDKIVLHAKLIKRELK